MNLLDLLFGRKSYEKDLSQEEIVQQPENNISQEEIIQNAENIAENLIKPLFEKSENSYFSMEEKNIDKLEKLIKEEILDIVLDDKIYAKDEQLEVANQIVEDLNEIKELYFKPWLLKGSIISVTGKFSAGKTSLINSLLKMGNILPTDTKAATAVPTYIVPNLENIKPNKEFVAVAFNGNMRKFHISILKSIKKEIADSLVIPLPAIIESFIVPTEGTGEIVVIDTPGYNPGDKNSDYDKRRATQSIEIADKIFYVLDISDGGLSKDAVHFIKFNIAEKEKDLYIIINKVDKKPPKSRKAVKEGIQETLRKEGIPYKDIFLFTSNEKRLDRIKNKEKDTETINDIERLRSLINDLSNNNTKISEHKLFKSLYEILDKASNHSYKYSKYLSMILELEENIMDEEDDEFIRSFIEKVKSLDKNLIKEKIKEFSDLDIKCRKIRKELKKIQKEMSKNLVFT